MQVEELTEGVVSGPDSLRAFFAAHANTNVCLHDHGHIVGAVADRQSDPFLVVLGEPDHVSLLLRRNSAADDGGGK